MTTPREIAMEAVRLASARDEAREELAALRQENSDLRAERDNALDAVLDASIEPKDYARLRERASDLELLARSFLGDTDADDAPTWNRHWCPLPEPSPWIMQTFDAHGRNTGSIRLDDDGTGLPLLTPDARARLRGEK